MKNKLNTSHSYLFDQLLLVACGPDGFDGYYGDACFKTEMVSVPKSGAHQLCKGTSDRLLGSQPGDLLTEQTQLLTEGLKNISDAGDNMHTFWTDITKGCKSQ